MQPFLDEVHAQIVAAPLAHVDETGARAEGKPRWLFSASTERATFYSLHDKRGFEGLDHAGVLPNFNGIAVHRDRYQQIITLGYQTNPAATIPTGKGGVIRQTRPTTYSSASTVTVTGPFLRTRFAATRQARPAAG